MKITIWIAAENAAGTAACLQVDVAAEWWAMLPADSGKMAAFSPSRLCSLHLSDEHGTRLVYVPAPVQPESQKESR